MHWRDIKGFEQRLRRILDQVQASAITGLRGHIEINKEAIAKIKSAIAEQIFDETEFADFVASHGQGDPTEAGLEAGRKLFAIDGDMAKAAFEIVFQGLVAPEEDHAASGPMEETPTTNTASRRTRTTLAP